METRTIEPQLGAAPKKSKARRAYLVLALMALAALAAYFIHGYLTRDQVYTDDAEVDADVVPVATRVGGVVLHMDVHDDQPVAVGAVIAEIDPGDFAAKVSAAQADLDAAKAQADAADAQVDITRSASTGGLSSAKATLRGTDASVKSAAAQAEAAAAAVARAHAELAKAASDYARTEKLHDAGAVSGEALEAATMARDSAQAALDAANANLAAARDQQASAQSRVAAARGALEQSTPVDRKIAAAVAAAQLAHAHVASAQAALDLAKLQLGYTKITAPAAGVVSKLVVHDGQLVQPGMTLLMVVPRDSYVIANFKETQLERIAAGDPVDVSVDAASGTFHGTVASISPGTGARFSLMPPDNATGNFVKVVQRVPVKILWDPGQDLSKLHAGLSAEVTVHLRSDARAQNRGGFSS